jgi:hypothetical protein
MENYSWKKKAEEMERVLYELKRRGDRQVEVR